MCEEAFFQTWDVTHPLLALQAVNPFPESLLFQQLVAAERDADALLTARRAEVAACLAPAPTVTKKLRVYMFATHSGQPAPSGEFQLQHHLLHCQLPEENHRSSIP